MFLLSLFTTEALCQNAPFEAHEATIESIHNALLGRSNTCRDVISAFTTRIEAFNPLINAVISLNPDALQAADYLDQRIKQGNFSGSLFCIPVLLKDNFDFKGLPTTAGCEALKDSYPVNDAITVSALQRAGAIILGKTNLHEFALEGLSVSSLGGQTINPYDFTRTPGGSSGGSGAAIAASFAMLATGTDTVNSLRNPASANSIYSFRPTRGLISRAGVVPVSFWQDAVGAMGRSIADIAVALEVMSSIGSDPADNATITACASRIVRNNTVHPIFHYSPRNLNGKRIGILYPFINYTSSNETDPVTNSIQKVLKSLTSQNATLIHLNSTIHYSTYDPNTLLSLDLQQHEFSQQLTTYLSSPDLIGPHPKSMSSLYLNSSGGNSSTFLVIPKQYPYIHTALKSSTSSPEYQSLIPKIETLTQTLHNEFQTQNLDAIIYPQQRNLVVPLSSPSQSSRNGVLAALIGFPVVAIPMGFSPATDTAPIGIPIGMEVLGLPWSEDLLFDIAGGIDSILKARRPPVLPELTIENREMYYEEMPVVRPSGVRNVDLDAYPTGVF